MTTARQVARLHDERAVGVRWPLFTSDKDLVTWSGTQVHRWNLAEGKLRQVVDLSFPPNWGTALAPDGNTLAVVPRDAQGPISLWDTATGKERFKLPGELAHGGF